jgi:putative transposase
VGAGKSLAAVTGAWVCFEDESGQGLRPPKARTWSKRGHTPVVAVTARGSGRVSVAGLIAVRPGHRSRLFFRMRVHHGHKGEPKGLSEADYMNLLRQAHIQLQAPIVLVWDNLNTHTSKAMRTFIDAQPWLTVIRLPAYTPELNPVEGVWANVKNNLGNLAARSIDQVAATTRTLLKRIQYRPDLIDGFVAGTGLTLDTEPQWT